jgi:hypothetical protein
LTTQGTTDYNNFNTAMTRLDLRLTKSYWIGDPAIAACLGLAAVEYITDLESAVALVAAAGNPPVTLHAPKGTYTLTSSVTLQSCIELKPERGASFVLGNFDLNINGTLDAGNYQIFVCAGTGKPVFGPGAVEKAYAEWFGNIVSQTTDCTAMLQFAINSLPNGGTLQLLDKVYKHTGISVTKSLSINGLLPPSYWDNDSFNALGGGSRLWQYAATGDNVTIRPPNLGDRRIEVSLTNICLIGAKFNGTGLTGTPTSGRGLFIDGRQQAETSVFISLNNVFSSYHKDQGIDITGAVYGVHLGRIGANGNGKQNLRIIGQTDPIGEFSADHLRMLGGGGDGATDMEKAGIYINSSGNFKFGFVTSTGALGAGLMVGGGNYEIGVLHCETPSGTPGATHVMVQAGDGTSNPSALQIRSMNIAPGTNYPGTVLLCKNGSRRVRIDNFVVNDIIDTSGTALHVNFESGSESCVIKGVSVATGGGDNFKVTDADGDNYVESLHPHFRVGMSAAAANATGDGTIVLVVLDTVQYDNTSSFNTGTYLYTIPTSGVYSFSAQILITGADGINHTNFGIIIEKNSASTIARNELPLLPTSCWPQTQYIGRFVRGDTIGIKVYVEGGAKTVSVGSTSNAFAYLQGTMIAPSLGTY